MRTDARSLISAVHDYELGEKVDMPSVAADRARAAGAALERFEAGAMATVSGGAEIKTPSQGRRALSTGTNARPPGEIWGDTHAYMDRGFWRNEGSLLAEMAEREQVRSTVRASAGGQGGWGVGERV
jgi:hypothetical protein